MKLIEAEQAHWTLLARWRGSMDLIGPGDAMPHFIDAAHAVTDLPVDGRWADLGSGAGFPGIALTARHPDAHVQLVESRRKRSIFLDQVLAHAQLTNDQVIRGRVESLPDGQLDGVISRAYKPPPAYLVDAYRLLRVGGLAVLMLGDGGAAPAEAQRRWTLRSTYRYPVGDGWRRRVVLQKR